MTLTLHGCVNTANYGLCSAVSKIRLFRDIPSLEAKNDTDQQTVQELRKYRNVSLRVKYLDDIVRFFLGIIFRQIYQDAYHLPRPHPI